jgi:hypothetical protein
VENAEMNDGGWRGVPPAAGPVEVAGSSAPQQVRALPVGATAFASSRAGWALVGTTAEFRLLYTADGGGTWATQLAWYGFHYGRVSALDERRAGLVLGADLVNGIEVGPRMAGPILAGTDDGGGSWRLGRPPGNPEPSLHFLTPRQIWLVIGVPGETSKKGLALTEDGGATWRWHEIPGDLPPIMVAFTSRDDGLLVAADRYHADVLSVTADGGATWTRHRLASPPGVPARAETWLFPIVRPATEPLLLLRAHPRRSDIRLPWAGAFMYTRTDADLGGWSGPHRLPMTSDPRHELAVPGTDGRIWAASGHDLWVIDDATNGWKHRTVPLDDDEAIADLSPVDDAVLWLTTTRSFPGTPPSGELYRSEDDGAHWTRLSVESR